MDKISLRVYNQEIEGLITGGQLEEAIAHCHHILDSYSMHIETYRLLGKAYLESRRYGDATDIFQRVLNAVPDDFVSHVGMSIIRDDENKRDEAIWHMERAFEVQPSNPAIQNELRRLYGRRDGVEPAKIRLSRDALANMYAQGDLFVQAIAEIRAGRMIVLMDDEDRENEGDICMAAEKVSPEAIAFMARYARGLICLPLTDEKLAELGLPMMVAENSTPLGTAFTLSIDARCGIGSGISAADRAGAGDGDGVRRAGLGQFGPDDVGLELHAGDDSQPGHALRPFWGFHASPAAVLPDRIAPSMVAGRPVFVQSPARNSPGTSLTGPGRSASRI